MHLSQCKGHLLTIYLRDHLAAYNDRLVKLCNLKVPGTVRVEIGFPIKLTEFGNCAVNRTPKLDRFAHSLFIQYWQCPWLPCANFCDVGIGFIAKPIGRGTKQFRFGIELHMDL